jgi:hypothetical protein
MPQLISRTVTEMNKLPRPPGAPERSHGVDPIVVVAIVVVVLGVVVLIAWLLKPVVARRLTEAETADAVAEPRQAEPVVEPGPVDVDVPDASDEVSVEGRDFVPQIDLGTVAPSLPPVAEPPRVEQPLAEIPQDRDGETDDIVGITLAVRELLDHANAGQLLRGFALYSESFFRRFRAETGLSAEEFEATFATVPAPPPEARAELAAITDVEWLADGRVTALVTYANGDQRPAPERYIFVRADGDRWLIDDISTET